MKVVSAKGDTVDEICWQHYGKTQGVTEQVYEANPGLCDRGVRLPAGLRIYLPEVAQSSTKEVVQLWD